MQRFTLKLLSLAAVALAVSACNSSSSSNPELQAAQSFRSFAIDGYIVGAEVFCDDTSSGITAAGGSFSCPAETQISKVIGGYDVGFDETKTTGDGGTPFTGTLSAPASAEYVTPMTSLSLAIALADISLEDFTLENYDSAQTTLASTLGIDVASLSANPAEDIVVAQTNSMVHQVLIAFAPNESSYEIALDAFASVISEANDSSNTISLTTSVDTTIAAINTELAETEPSLEKSATELAQIQEIVSTANEDILETTSHTALAAEAAEAILSQSQVTINRADATVTLFNDNSCIADTGDSAVTLTISEYENAIQTNGLYDAQLSSGLMCVSYDNDVFNFNQNINDAQVSVAFEVKSVNADDQWAMSIFSDDVIITASEGDSDSLVVSFSDTDATFDIVATDISGVVTNAVIETNEETLRSDRDSLFLDLERVNRKLNEVGFGDVLTRQGDYSVTLVISGLRFNEQDGTDISHAQEYTISVGEETVIGSGFKGYVSIY